MNGNNFPNEGARNRERPFYMDYVAKQQAARNNSNSNTNMNGNANTIGGGRYVPPALRDSDMIRPESSMSNISEKTFASQVPNYTHSPVQLAADLSAMNLNNGMRTPSGQPNLYLAQGMARGRADIAAPPTTYGITSSNNNAITLMQPTPVRRDSGAPQSRAAYLADRIKRGEADDPFDPDYGNPGPTKRPVSPPKPIPFPTEREPGKAVLPKWKGEKITDNTNGNSKAFFGSKAVAIPEWLPAALQGMPPGLERVYLDMPFIEATRAAMPSTAGVIKIMNIPYATGRAEINGFLGKNTQICHQPKGSGFYAIHIIMDRHSGKTMDAFVEVSTPAEAVWVVNQFQKRVMQKRPGRLGNRVVEVELSSQDELMHAIFPRCKQVTWEGGVPIVDPKRDSYYPGTSATGFCGFLQDDECYHMIQHAEKPQRSPFVQRNMIRTYEYLISTLHKYPWFAHEHCLLIERDRLFKSVYTNVGCLIELLRKIGDKAGADASKPTSSTLIELAMAVFVCPGFTDKQKAQVATLMEEKGFGRFASSRALDLHFGGVDSMFAVKNPFVGLVMQPGVEDRVVEYYAGLLREATVGAKVLSLADLHAMRANTNKEEKFFGELRIDYGDSKSLADVGRVELRYLEYILGRILPRAGSTGTPSLTNGSSSLSSRSGGLRLL